MLKRAWISCVLAFYCNEISAASAQIKQSIYDLSLHQLMQVKTISIATGTNKPLNKVPAVASVITAQEIKQLGANSIYDILEQITGLHIYPSNYNRMNPNFSIRGIHTTNNPQTLLLINGVRISYEFSGGRWDQLQISTENIDRIEIIRGPGSAIYGSDAYSGVINIITKGISSASSKSLGAKSGSFNTQTIWGNFIHNKTELQYSFSGQYYHTDGDDGRIIREDRMYALGPSNIALSNAPGPLDTRRETFDLRTEIKYHGLQGSLWYLKNNAGTGFGIANVLSTGDWEKLQAITLEASYRWVGSPSWHTELKLSYQKMDKQTYFVIFPAGFSTPREFDDSGTASAFTVFTDGMIGSPLANDKYLNASIVSKYYGFDGHSFRSEIGYRKSQERPQEFKNFGPGVLNGNKDFVDATLTDVTNTPYIYMNNQQRELGFFSFQDEWQIADDWEIVVGARFDRYSDFGSTFNPRLAWVWDISPTWTTKFLYGEAFRAPSMQELYVTNNPVTQGNPNLKPEEIRFYEFVLDHHAQQDWQVTTNIYAYKAQALIDSSLSTDGITRFNNVGEQDGYGIEFEARWEPSNTFNSKFGYTWQHSKSVSTGQDIPDAPKQVANISLNWTPFDNLSIHINAHWIMDRKRTISDPRPPIDDYVWTNLIFSYELKDNLVSKLIIRNLFADARAPSTVQLPEDFPQETRGTWLSLEYQF